MYTRFYILLTDAVPAEIPFVAGVLSLSPATPNSHVALLFQTFSIPFGHLARDEDVQAAQNLVDQEIVLRLKKGTGVLEQPCQVLVMGTAGLMNAQEKAELLSLKIPAPLAIDAIQPYGAPSASTEILQLTDVEHFGGKASNFGAISL